MVCNFNNDPFTFVLLVLGFILSFAFSLTIGANDVANSFGTCVGAGVLTFPQACVCAIIVETLGAVLLGFKVAATMRLHIVDITIFKGKEIELMIGFTSALICCTLWMIIVNYKSLCVSTTHCIVSAIIGFALVSQGWKGLRWLTVLSIADEFILSAENPIERVFDVLPLVYGLTMCINFLSLLTISRELPIMPFPLPMWLKLLTTIAIGIITMVFVHFLLLPWQKRQIFKEINVKRSHGQSHNSQVNGEESEEYVHQYLNVDETATTSQNKKENHMSQRDKSTDELQNNGRRSHGQSHNSQVNVEESEEYVLQYLNVEETATTSQNKGENHMSQRDKSTDELQNDIDQNQFVRTNENDSIRLSSRKVSFQGNTDVNFESAIIKIDGYSESENAKPKSILKSQLYASETVYLNSSHSVRTVHSHRYKGYVDRLFAHLHILTALFTGFAHGGNDVSNSTSALVAMYMICEGFVLAEIKSPLLFLFYGGMGIALGFCLFGRRLIKTMGSRLVKITASDGFAIEIGSAIIVLIANLEGLPISTTHCKIGSIVLVGYGRYKTHKKNEKKRHSLQAINKNHKNMDKRENVNWKLFLNMLVVGVLEMPLNIAMSATIMHTICHVYYVVSKH